MYSVHDEYPTNLSYYCSFRDKSLGNYFIASELKVSAKSQNKVQTYYAQVLWYSLQPWKGILLFISPVKAKLLFKYSKMMFQIFSIMQSIHCVWLTHRWMRTSVDSFFLHLINKQTCSDFFWWRSPLLHRLSLPLASRGLSSCGAWAPHWAGFPCFRMWALWTCELQ